LLFWIIATYISKHERLKVLLFIVLLAAVKRCSELDFDLPRQPADELTMVPGPALFSYELIHQAATPYSRLRCAAMRRLLRLLPFYSSSPESKQTQVLLLSRCVC